MAGPSRPEDIALHFTGEVEDNEDMVNKHEEKAGIKICQCFVLQWPFFFGAGT